ERLHRRHDLFEPNCVSPEHWPTAVRRETVAIDVDKIDVARAAGNLLCQDPGAFVHQWMQQARENLLRGDVTSLDTTLPRDLLDERAHLRIGVTRAALVSVVTLAGLLPEPSAHDESCQQR